LQQNNKTAERPLPLTAERARELLHYDAGTGVLRWRVGRRGKARAGSIAGLRLDQGHVRVRIDGRPYYAHRVIFLMMTRRWPRHEIDHRNGIPSDNRWINLREATRAQNGRNRRTQRNNTSGIKGVRFNKRAQKWVASIRADSRSLHLGLHGTREQAAAAYASAAQIYHGEYARAA